MARDTKPTAVTY